MEMDSNSTVSPPVIHKGRFGPDGDETQVDVTRASLKIMTVFERYHLKAFLNLRVSLKGPCGVFFGLHSLFLTKTYYLCPSAQANALNAYFFLIKHLQS